MNSPKRLLAAAAVAYCVSLAAHADCVLPPAPSKVPDGKTASEQEMVTAMQTLKEYNGDVETYLKCIDFEAKQNRMSGGDQEKLHNAAVDTLTKVASKFNEQVRTFKSKSG
jgi:hypothetical protein